MGVLVPVVVTPLVVSPDVLVLAIPLAVLPVIVVMIVTVVLRTSTLVRVFAALIAMVIARVFVTKTVVVVTARPSARELEITIAIARSRAIALAILVFGHTSEDGFSTSHEGGVKAFALPDLGIRERHLGFLSWDEAQREVESRVGVVAFGKEVPVFGGVGIEFDEF